MGILFQHNWLVTRSLRRPVPESPSRRIKDVKLSNMAGLCHCTRSSIKVTVTTASGLFLHVGLALGHVFHMDLATGLFFHRGFANGFLAHIVRRLING